MSQAPEFITKKTVDGATLTLVGDWTLEQGRRLEVQADALLVAASGRTTIDMSRVRKMDTAGAWVIDRSRAGLSAAGTPSELTGASPAHKALMREACYRQVDLTPRADRPTLASLLSDVGESVVGAWRDVLSGVAFLGHLVIVLLRVASRPERWRWIAGVYHLEAFAIRSAPIIALINFLVGAIVAQQGIFQLSRFGASAFAVDLIGILVLRELGVLLTSIMIAGRSGSAITAEIGSMNMREEIDALRVMALDPLEVLVLPRVLALIVSLPLLTFLADMSAIFGGLCVAWVYGDISPQAFLTRLQDAIGVNTFAVGLIKAPVMGLVIGLIAVSEGFAVKGSAESLGRKVTASVVKSIFMVIVIDGIFAILFATVRY